jgi:hypothetical protein
LESLYQDALMDAVHLQTSQKPLGEDISICVEGIVQRRHAQYKFRQHRLMGASQSVLRAQIEFALPTAISRDMRILIGRR